VIAPHSLLSILVARKSEQSMADCRDSSRLVLIVRMDVTKHRISGRTWLGVWCVVGGPVHFQRSPSYEVASVEVTYRRRCGQV